MDVPLPLTRKGQTMVKEPIRIGAVLILATLIGFSMLTGCGSESDDSPNLVGTKVQENKAFFELNGIEDFYFDFDDNYSISVDKHGKPQPWEGITSFVGRSDDGLEAGIVIAYAGRHKSGPVARWFKDQMPNGRAVGCDSKDDFPRELNLAFTGNMEITIGGVTYTCEDIVLGQGSTGITASNTWWIGSKDTLGADKSIFGGIVKPCKAPGQLLKTLIEFWTDGMCVNTFAVHVGL